MQAIARKVKSLRGVGGVERGQNIFALIDEVSSDPAAVATLKKSLKSHLLAARAHMPQCTLTSVTCQPETCGQSRDLEQMRTNALPGSTGTVHQLAQSSAAAALPLQSRPVRLLRLAHAPERRHA